MLVSARYRLALVVGAVGLIGAALLYPTDEKRVRRAAEAIVAGANEGDSALAFALAAHATLEVSVTIAELDEPLVGPEALVGAARRARQREEKLYLQLESPSVRIEGNRARLDADVITALRPEVPELRRPRRSFAIFERRGDGFRLVSAQIGAERQDLPEERP